MRDAATAVLWRAVLAAEESAGAVACCLARVGSIYDGNEGFDIVDTLLSFSDDEAMDGFCPRADAAALEVREFGPDLFLVLNFSCAS